MHSTINYHRPNSITGQSWNNIITTAQPLRHTQNTIVTIPPIQSQSTIPQQSGNNRCTKRPGNIEPEEHPKAMSCSWVPTSTNTIEIPDKSDTNPAAGHSSALHHSITGSTYICHIPHHLREGPHQVIQAYITSDIHNTLAEPFLYKVYQLQDI